MSSLPAERLARLQRDFPPGTEVTVFRYDGSAVDTTTVTAVQLIGNGLAVVQVAGVEGYCDLGMVTPRRRQGFDGC